MKKIMLLLWITLSLPALAESCPRWSEREKTENIARLAHEIAHHNDLYFNKNAPIISDEEYDALVARLATWQTCFPHIKIEPPVTGNTTPDKEATTHYARLGSLKKADSEEEIATFFQQTLNGEALLQPKIDGLAVELVYENGQLIKASTRGNSGRGMNILTVIRKITFIPKTIPLDKRRKDIHSQTLILHGELFTRLDKIAPDLLKQYTSARHLVAGQINRSEPNPKALSAIDFFPWSWIDSPYPSELETIKALALLGFQLPLEYTRPVGSFEEIKQLRHDYQNNRTAPFLMDGIVIKANSEKLRKSLGWQSNNPVWAMAWKFPPARAVSEVTHIEFTIGRTGKITPVLHFEPVMVQEETVTRVSLGSVHNLQQKDIAIGDHISVLLKGRATPVFSHVLFRPQQRVLPSLPDIKHYNPFTCLSMSPECEQQFIARLVWLTGKQGLDLPIDRDIIRELVLSGKIKTLVDILQPDQDSLIGAGLSTQSSQQYLQSLGKPKSLKQQLRAISLPGVGKSRVEELSECIDGVGELLSISTEQLEQCSGVSNRLILKIKSYLERSELSGVIEWLERSIPTQSEAVAKVQKMVSRSAPSEPTQRDPCLGFATLSPPERSPSAPRALPEGTR